MNRVARMRARVIIYYWIATPSAMARNDKNIVCAGAQESHDLGPAVKPRDDKFLSSFIL